MSLRGFNQAFQFEHRCLRLENQPGKIFGLFDQGVADRWQIGARDMQVAAGLLEIRQRDLKLIDRGVGLQE